MRKVKNLILLFVALSFLVCSGPQILWAENLSAQNPEFQRKFEFWKKLKNEQPEEFRELVQARKREIKERMLEMKEDDPERFLQAKERMMYGRKQHLRRLRDENPAKFEQIMQKRAARFDAWQRQNPERATQFLDRHPRFKDKLQSEGFMGDLSQRQKEPRSARPLQRDVDFKDLKRREGSWPRSSGARDSKVGRHELMDTELLKHESPIRYYQFMKHNPQLDKRVREHNRQRQNFGNNQSESRPNRNGGVDRR